VEEEHHRASAYRTAKGVLGGSARLEPKVIGYKPDSAHGLFCSMYIRAKYIHAAP